METENIRIRENFVEMKSPANVWWEVAYIFKEEKIVLFSTHEMANPLFNGVQEIKKHLKSEGYRLVTSPKSRYTVTGKEDIEAICFVKDNDPYFNPAKNA